MSDTAKPAWYEEGGKEPLPGWFDPAKHSAGFGGIVETATGTLLDLDGLPASGPLRAERLAAADVPAPAVPTASAPTTHFASQE